MEHGMRLALLVVKKEVITNVRNLKMPTALVTMTLLQLLSAYLLALDYQRRLNNWTANQVSQRSAFVGGIVKYNLPDGSFFHRVGSGHGPPMQRPEPFSALIKGMDGEVDRAVSVNQQIIFGARQDDPATSGLFGVPDTSFFIKLLVSLFALMFSLGAVTREKEAGTLKAALAQPIRRLELILYKSLGAAISLLGPFALACAGQVTYLHCAHGLLNNREDVIRALLIFGLGALYGVVFVNVGLFISTIAARTKVAVMTALLAWATFVLVLPNAAVLMAKLLSPSPSYNQFRVRLHDARQQFLRRGTPSNQAAGATPEQPITGQALLDLFEIERQLTDDYLESKTRQNYQARLFTSLSPAGALAFGLSDVAGTGVGANSSYLEFFRSGQDAMLDALKRRLDLPPREGDKLVEAARDMVAHRQRLREPLAASLRSTAIPITSLLVWATLFGVASCWRFKRYDVR
jgi:ABC-2 type transport system permease protein